MGWTRRQVNSQSSPQRERGQAILVFLNVSEEKVAWKYYWLLVREPKGGQMGPSRHLTRRTSFLSQLTFQQMHMWWDWLISAWSKWDKQTGVLTQAPAGEVSLFIRQVSTISVSYQQAWLLLVLPEFSLLPKASLCSLICWPKFSATALGLLG